MIKKSRIFALLRHDRAILRECIPPCRLVGLDEVGRGSLITGVVGGAVWIPPILDTAQKTLLRRLNDSKKLSRSVRAELSEGIQSFCRVGIGETTPEEVDRLNVHYASLLALYRAFTDLCGQMGDPWGRRGERWFLMLDGRAVIPDLDAASQRAIVRGDSQSAAIAAASVVAKETRDAHIRALAKQYPGYGWERNMGYATPEHLAAIETLGLTPLHRKSFRQVVRQLTLPLSQEGD